MADEQETQVEPWMTALKEAVEAGYYQRDSASESSEPLPDWRYQVSLTTSKDVYALLVRAAEVYDWSLEDAISMVFHVGLRAYTDDKRTRAWKAGLWPDWQTNPASVEVDRIMRADHKKKGWL